MKRACLLTFVAAIAVALAAPARAIDTTDTRMLGQPAISKTHLAFVYAGDLWAAGLDGRNVRRLTSGQGVASPAFSPDGSLIAFTARYEGNADVYVVPVAGGVPTRLTWHPGADLVQGFTPDGAAVVFTSAREVFSGRYAQMFTVPVKGGAPGRVELPYAFRGTFSPDGARIAYNPLYDAFTQWKHYRGGTHSTIWIYTLGSRRVEVLPQPPDRPNDVYPMWIGGTVYFLSDRAGEFNLFSYDPASKALKQLTRHDDFPILSASAGGGKVVYEQAGYLHVFDPAAGTASKVTIGVTADLPDLRPRFVKGARYVRDAALSPSGARALF
jgi:tricorn protease